MRIGIVVSHPIQYLVPLFRRLAAHPQTQVHVLYLCRAGVDEYYDEQFAREVRWDLPLLEGYSSTFLSSGVAPGSNFSGVFRAVSRARFDVLVVHGYSTVESLAAITAGKLVGSKVLLRGDTRLLARHGNRLGWKAWAKRAIFSVADGFLAIGTRNRDYYLAHGVRPERVFAAPFCVDNAFFALTEERRRSLRGSVRDRFGIADSAVVFLSLGKLTAQKRVDDAIGAFLAVCGQIPEAVLLIAGSGPEEADLRQRAAAAARACIHFTGFVNQPQIPELFAAADVFVFPVAAPEAWGLVLNEAMAAGLPVLTSDEAGAAIDLVDGKGTGYVFKCGDRAELASAMSKMAGNPDERAAMANRAKDLIRRYDIDACADACISAARSVSRPDTA